MSDVLVSDLALCLGKEMADLGIPSGSDDLDCMGVFGPDAFGDC